MLMGYSFGGLVALEMAQRLQESGKKVLLLILLDAYAQLNSAVSHAHDPCLCVE